MDLFSTSVISGATSFLTWFGTTLVNRAANKAATEERQAKDKIEHDERLEIHRDGLAFDLLNAAREEVAGARVEMNALRDEVQALRALEQHFYHFQQALDHLDAILYAVSADDRSTAERAARAFVTRMRRLNEAKGTIANEAQRATSAASIAEHKIIKVGKTGGPSDKKNVP